MIVYNGGSELTQKGWICICIRYPSASGALFQLLTAGLTLAHKICSGFTCLENLCSEKIRPDWKPKISCVPDDQLCCSARLLCAEPVSWPHSRRLNLFIEHGDAPLSTAPISETGRGSRENAELTSQKQSLGTKTTTPNSHQITVRPQCVVLNLCPSKRELQWCCFIVTQRNLCLPNKYSLLKKVIVKGAAFKNELESLVQNQTANSRV